jgi:hypothetical protein
MMWNRRKTRSTILAALGGPVALGAAMGLPFGVKGMLGEALALPELLLGMALLTTPALYIAATLIDAAPPASRMAKAVAAALRGAGLVMVGLAPVAGFLHATMLGTRFVYVSGALAVGGAVLAGLRSLNRDLVVDTPNAFRFQPLFALWAAVSMALGAHLFFATLGV